MPIKDKDYGKYIKRPDIYIEEIDNSITELPVQNVLINLVPGFSKKGPFNTPIYCADPNTFVSVYGDDDRRLENKGSYFHKTAKQMIKSGPVWALNLLATNPNRDKVDWQSISVSSQYSNGVVKRSAYEYFFNRQDFWERDTDAFLNIVKSNNSGVQDDQKLFHITNMGDKDITVWMYKSTITGFDVTFEDWYGDRTKVPAYVDYREWISDYIVHVAVVAGNWTDYKTLSNDTTFSKYFNKNGLIKGQTTNFLNERTVTVLGNWDVSLIPYFKDLNGNDMYIKSIINNNTDVTGLFCTYNEDSLLEADFKLGNLDVIGDVIVGQDITSIDFMSYKTTLKEAMAYGQKYLDSSNNVITNATDAFSQAYSVSPDTRTGKYTNGSTYNIYYDPTQTSTGATTSTVGLKFSSTGAFYVLNGALIQTSWLTTLDFPVVSSITYSSNYASRVDVLYLTSDNSTVNVLYGTQILAHTGATKPDYTYSLDNTIILGYITHSQNIGNIALSSATYTINYTPVTVGLGGYCPIGTTVPSGATTYTTSITTATDSIGDYLYITFNGTSGSTAVYNDYDKLRMLHAFNEIHDNISTQSVLITTGGTPSFSSGVKIPVINYVPVHNGSTTNAAIKIYCETPQLCYTVGKFMLYYIDDEFVLQQGDNYGFKTLYGELGDASYTAAKIGIAATYSQFYKDYFNGIINTMDYFYYQNNSGQSDKLYLDMYLDQSNILNVSFVDVDGYTPRLLVGWENSYLSQMIIYSTKSNWEQSVDISRWVGDDLTTCQQIYVNKERYSELTRGGFLAAYYDVPNWTAPDGAGYLEGSVPRKLTRIINVKNDVNDTTLKILYTDAPIKIMDVNLSGGTELSGQSSGTVNWQALTYPSIDVYVDEYQGMVLTPFVVNADSMPNGTDARQNSILNVISKDTNLAKALADKNKISWRYLIDSFGLGIEPIDGYGSKQQLADLCGLKLNALGFLNMPSAKDFKNSSNPSFVNDDGSLNTAFVKAGADESKNPDYLYQFAQKHGDIDGRSCVGYFFPYVRIYDNGIPKNVPPAAYAASTYMNKFTSNVAGLVPWTISAGITNGRINGITKTEMDFTADDLTNLHQMGANPIVYRVNNGYCILDESSAQIFPYSSLSFMHSREVLIELENRLYDMLLKYQWQFNTAEIRGEIKYRADKICKDMLDSNAFYDFYNICDESNNTNYVIDLQMGILDTYVEIIKGMGFIVNSITIMKKGEIKSQGFKQQ